MDTTPLQTCGDGLLDASIVFSFDRSGFRRHARGFAPADLDVDLTGRICLVTGANSGIGLETCRALARLGATVWMLCRDPQRGRRALEELRRDTGSGNLHLAVLDVSDLEAVRRFARDFTAPRVDVLVHNAGVLPEQRLSLDDVDWRRRRYDGVAACAATKRMQVVLAELLAPDLARHGVTVAAMHPGWADTPAEGADTVVWLAASRAARGRTGQFWFDRQPRSTHLLPWTRERVADRDALRDLCERATAPPAAARAGPLKSRRPAVSRR